MTRPATVRLVLAAALVCTPLAAGAQFLRPLGDERLDALATRYFVAERHDDPVGATQSGVHDEDDAPGAYTPDAYADRLATAKRFLAELRAIDSSETPASYCARAAPCASGAISRRSIGMEAIPKRQPPARPRDDGASTRGSIEIEARDGKACEGPQAQVWSVRKP